MSAGMPGLGLGGIFFVLSALAAVLLELPRLTRGQSSVETWREIGRNVLISLLIVAMLDLVLRGVFFVAWLLGGGSADRLTEISVLPLGPLSITLLLLASLLSLSKAAQLGFRSRDLFEARRSERRRGRRFVHGASCPCCSD